MVCLTRFPSRFREERHLGLKRPHEGNTKASQAEETRGLQRVGGVGRIGKEWLKPSPEHRGLNKPGAHGPGDGAGTGAREALDQMRQ